MLCQPTSVRHSNTTPLGQTNSVLLKSILAKHVKDKKLKHMISFRATDNEREASKSQLKQKFTVKGHVKNKFTADYVLVKNVSRALDIVLSNTRDS